MAALNDPTPQKNTMFWKIGTMIFFLAVFINENFALICELGFPERVEKVIRVVGLVTYFLFTKYQFSKTTFGKPLRNDA